MMMGLGEALCMIVRDDELMIFLPVAPAVRPNVNGILRQVNINSVACCRYVQLVLS